jgi:hypothetical protein
VQLAGGAAEFRHPLARSAIYARAPAEQRRAAHRALAAALPDRDDDRRAWHLASAAVGADDAASTALEQAARRARARSAYATASAAHERAGRLADDGERRARMLFGAAEAGLLAGLGDRALALLDQSRADTTDMALLLDIDELEGRITTRRGPVMDGRSILVAAADRADPGRAVEMLAEATVACFAAGNPTEMLAVAERADALMPAVVSSRTRFLSATALGMANVLGGDAAKGAGALREAISLAEGSAELRGDIGLLPWLPLAPLFLREADTGRSLLDDALNAARAHAAVGVLPFVLSLIARAEAAGDRWAIAEAGYREAIELARETDQQTDLVFSLTGLAFVEARRGQSQRCRAHAAEALELCRRLGTRLLEVWAHAALADLALGEGDAAAAAAQLEAQSRLLGELGITDPDLSPAAELVDAYLRLGRRDDAETVAPEFVAAARAKAQP